jgi:hemoglobin-like flavoprotein
MLSEKSARTIRATLPAVGGAIGDIAPLLYDKLFAAHPALLRDLFNRGNQANGAQGQALAGAIVAFATATVSNTGVRPDTMLARIAHKHASLGITPGQYRIVNQHLLAAIAEVTSAPRATGPATAPVSPISAASPLRRTRPRTSAVRCPSCARSAPSCWSAVSGPPTSTTKSSAPTSGCPDACRRPRYSAIGR